MPGNHLEELVAGWYQWRGYFVRRNVQVGRRAQGGYECELDVVAFHPKHQKLVHIEPSLDGDRWDKRENRYSKKFDAGRKYIPALFEGLTLPTAPEQIALFVVGGGTSRTTLGGGKVVFIKQFMRTILEHIRSRRLNSAAELGRHSRGVSAPANVAICGAVLAIGGCQCVRAAPDD